jgi:hypothetical protein
VSDFFYSRRQYEFCPESAHDWVLSRIHIRKLIIRCKVFQLLPGFGTDDNLENGGRTFTIHRTVTFGVEWSSDTPKVCIQSFHFLFLTVRYSVSESSLNDLSYFTFLNSFQFLNSPFHSIPCYHNHTLRDPLFEDSFQERWFNLPMLFQMISMIDCFLSMKQEHNSIMDHFKR